MKTNVTIFQEVSMLIGCSKQITDLDYSLQKLMVQ